jgi:glycosyltransferase involved in cell wall biosynthesis
MFTALTPLILTYNEAPNIRRTLEKLTWAKDILVVDSFSTDETLAIVKSFPTVRVIQRKFDSHSAQWNFGLDSCTSPLVLALDADYVLSDALVQELQSAAISNGGHAAWSVRFRYCINGRPLCGTLYPPKPVLFRRDSCRFEQDGHTQRLRVEGTTGCLSGCIDHDDRKSLSHWLWAQSRYADLEAQTLTSPLAQNSSIQDRLRRYVVLAPALVFFYTLIGKGLILDGWPGWYYVFQRTLAEMLLSLRLIEEKLGEGRGKRGERNGVE